MRLGLILAAAVVLALPAASAGKPPWLIIVEDCLTQAEQRQVVGFRAADGTRLAALVQGRGSTGVVLIHGSRSTYCEWTWYSVKLARSYRVLSLDLRGNGSSYPSPVSRNLARYDLDVAAAVGFLRQGGAKRVYVMGSSLGAGVAVLGAATVKPPLAGAIALSSPAVSGGDYDTLGAARRATIPILFVASEEDRTFPADARRLYRVSASPRKQLLVVKGSGHGSGLLTESGPAAAVAKFLAGGG